jgi:hypothetical protein
VGNQVALIGVVPEPSHIFDQLTAMLNQGVVDGDHTPAAITGFRIALQPLQTAILEGVLVSGGFGEPAVQTPLIRGDGKHPVDAADGFVLCHHQVRQVFGKMLSCGFIGKEIAKDVERVLPRSWENPQ